MPSGDVTKGSTDLMDAGDPISWGVVLINWNQPQDTLECVESIANQRPNFEVKTIVVDNASSGDDVERITRHCTKLGLDSQRLLSAHIGAAVGESPDLLDVTIVEASENLGFCVANNLGAALAFAAGCDWVLILNNDTALEPDCLSQLQRAAETAGTAPLLSPQVVFFDDPDRVWWRGGDFTTLLRPRYRGQGQARVTGSDLLEKTEWVTGCATAISRETYDQLGLYDPVYFIWCEEWDLSLRAQEAKVPMLVANGAIVRHKVGRSLGIVSPLTFYYSTRNMLILRRRYLRRSIGVLVIGPYLARKIAQAVLLAVRYRDAKFLKALFDAFRGRAKGGMWPLQAAE